jgi:polyisoprenoid-binding protein YceI
VTRYSIDPVRSQVWIDARSSVHPIHSSTSGLEGYVEIDFEPTGVVDLGRPPAGRLSLAVDRLRSGNRLEDRELQKRIDAKRFPLIEGVLTSMRPAESGGFLVSGDVTFRGMSRSHQDMMEIVPIDDRSIRLTGSSRFDIRDYGMEPPKVLMLKVEPEVVVRVEIVAQRDGGGADSAGAGG